LIGLAAAWGATVADVQRVSAETADGQIVCNPTFDQVPGHPDDFVGRGLAIGTLDYCHTALKGEVGFLALFKMDWQRHKLILHHKLLTPPLKTPSGVDLHGAIDPYVASYNGEYWMAFECTVPGAVSACMVPLANDLSKVDLSRFSVAALGTIGPFGPKKQVVCLESASAPVLLSDAGGLYLYWQVDFFDNRSPANLMVTRGMQVKADSHGRMWGVGSGGKPVATGDAKLTTVAHDVVHDNVANDAAANHVAITWDLVTVGGKILEIASIGGTSGPEVCRSGHDNSPGCWRMSLSLADAPLGPNVFGKHPLAASSALPGNMASYPRVIVDPAGKHYLLGIFDPPKAAPPKDRAKPLVERGLFYFPFEPEEAVKQ
jgi:hypothetical protein